MDAVKNDEFSIKVTKVDTKEVVYLLDQLLKQKEAIEKQRDAELAEVNELIQACTDLGVQPTPQKD